MRRRPGSRERDKPECSTSISSDALSTRRVPALVRIDFFNYGEAFLHKRAVEMCEYIKSRFPHIYLFTSTNGLALSGSPGAAPGSFRYRRSNLLDRWCVA